MGAFTASGSLAVGSSAFSSTEAARQTNVDVVGDENAYLRLEYGDKINVGAEPKAVEAPCGEPIRLFDVTNQFPKTIESLTIELTGNSFDICQGDCGENGYQEESCTSEVLEIGGNLASNGDCETVWLVPDSSACGGESTITLDIEAIGDGFSVNAIREFEITLLPFESLTVDPDTQTQGNNSRIKSATFVYELRGGNPNLEFIIEYNEERESRTNPDGSPVRVPQNGNLNNNKDSLPATFTVIAGDNACYTITSSSPDTLDLLEDGESC